jgi:hypothetical protein
MAWLCSGSASSYVLHFRCRWMAAFWRSEIPRCKMDRLQWNGTRMRVNFYQRFGNPNF